MTECTGLSTFNCSNNPLTSIDVTKNTALKELSCDKTQLTSIDVTKNTALEKLNCDDNQLTSIDVTKNLALRTLSCDKNQLTSIDVTKNTALSGLYCGDNPFTTIDLTQNTQLSILHIPNHQLTTIDLRNNPELFTIRLINGKLESIQLPSELPQLQDFDIFYNRIKAAEMEKIVTETTFGHTNQFNLIKFSQTGERDLNEITESLRQKMIELGIETVSEEPRCTPEELEILHIYDIGYATLSPRRNIRLNSVEGIYKVVATTDRIKAVKLSGSHILDTHAVLLKGEEGHYYAKAEGATTSSVIRDLSGNLLHGVKTTTTVTPDEGNWVYILNTGRWSAGFYWQKGTNGERATLKPYSAYLQLPKSFVPYYEGGVTPAGVQGFSLDDMLITGISIAQQDNAQTSDSNAEVYDLAGRRVQRAGKGLYIVNGKKVIQ